MKDEDIIAQATMKLERITKGAVLYKSDVVGIIDKALTSIYLRQQGLDRPFPPGITVTISAWDSDHN